MGREKLKRKLFFKPRCKEFASFDCKEKNSIILLHEEIEAIYLSDILNLYQNDAAKEMGISRATFARILKNARSKVAMSLISGAKLSIQDEKDDFIVAVASNSKESLSPSSLEAPYIVVYHIKEEKILDKKVFDNPVILTKKRPGMVLPEFLNSLKVNFFIINEIRTGIKGALLAKGIFILEKKKLTEKDLFTLL